MEQFLLTDQWHFTWLGNNPEVLPSVPETDAFSSTAVCLPHTFSQNGQPCRGVGL